MAFGYWLGFPAFSRIGDSFCMLNRPAPGEYLGNQAIILIPRPAFSTLKNKGHKIALTHSFQEEVIMEEVFNVISDPFQL